MMAAISHVAVKLTSTLKFIRDLQFKYGANRTKSEEAGDDNLQHSAFS